MRLVALSLLLLASPVDAVQCPNLVRSEASANTCRNLARIGGVTPLHGACARLYPELFAGKAVPHCDSAPSAASGASTTRAEGMDPICEKAKINIDWVLKLDAGAQRRYAWFRQEGQSPVEAVISAQAHNGEAQRTIKACAGWAEQYIAASGMSTPAVPIPSTRVQSEPPPDLQCMKFLITDDYETQKKEGATFYEVRIDTNHNCKSPVTLAVCVRNGREARRTVFHSHTPSNASKQLLFRTEDGPRQGQGGNPCAGTDPRCPVGC